MKIFLGKFYEIFDVKFKGEQEMGVVIGEILDLGELSSLVNIRR